MNRLNTVEECIEIYQSVKLGKTIQAYRTIFDDQFFIDLKKSDNPALNFQSYFYRVKPEAREWDVMVSSKGEISSDATHGRESIRVVEKLD